MVIYLFEFVDYYNVKELDIYSIWKFLIKEKEIEKLRKIIKGDD